VKLGLVVNSRQAAIDFAARLAAEGDRHGLESIWVDPLDPEEVDMVVAIGGDGTVLEASQASLALDVPLLGFNLGTIGFLAEVEPEQLDWTLPRLVEGRYRVEERLTLCARITGSDGASSAGVNDVVVEKIESQRLVALAIEVDGEEFLTYRADGIVIATSTGSTAYAFSAGGPLVDPSIDTLLVTPVAPHSLFNRTLVVPGDTAITAHVVADRPVRVSVDGREIGEVFEGGSIEITHGPRRAKFVRFDTETFPARITRKFDVR
jgi:NAD+ kinase